MIERFATVKIKELRPIDAEIFPECLIKTRRQHMQGTVDSPIYLNFNRHWLVKHITSGLIRGVSVSKYGIYHEDELEIIASAPAIKIEEPRGRTKDYAHYDDDAGFTYNDWDDIPD